MHGKKRHSGKCSICSFSCGINYRRRSIKRFGTDTKVIWEIIYECFNRTVKIHERGWISVNRYAKWIRDCTRRNSGAIAIQAEEIENSELVDKSKKLIICCSRGQNSIEVAENLVEKGYDAESLEGGYIAWL